MLNTCFRCLRLTHVGLSLALLSTAHAAVVAPATGTVVDGVAPAAVIELNPSGLGHVNIVPYYSVRSGLDTYLNLVNTDTRNGKAVKLRFLAAGSGDTVFGLTVLLSPGDKWAAAITRDATTGLPKLVLNDRSCTLPAQVQQTFQTSRLFGLQGARATDGHVEVITIADIPPRTGDGDPKLFATIKQVAGIAACDTTVLNSLATDPANYGDARSKGLEVPTTGLTTRWTLINVKRATSLTGVATALEARVAAGGAAGFGNLVFFPQTAVALGSVELVRRFTADPLLRGGVADNRGAMGQDLSAVQPLITALQQDFPDLSTPYLSTGLNPSLPPGAAPKLQALEVSKALAATSFANEFVLQPTIAAKTDWVLSFPTRRYNVGLPTHAANQNPIYTNLAVDDLGNPLAGAVGNYFTPVNSIGRSDFDLCYYGLYFYAGADPSPAMHPVHRAGTVFADQKGVSEDITHVSPSGPVTPLPIPLCGQATIMRFGNRKDQLIAGVLGELFGPFGVWTDSPGGWARFAMPGIDGKGIPMLGFAAMELFNGAAMPGMAGAYGQTFTHALTSPP